MKEVNELLAGLISFVLFHAQMSNLFQPASVPAGLIARDRARLLRGLRVARTFFRPLYKFVLSKSGSKHVNVIS